MGTPISGPIRIGPSDPSNRRGWPTTGLLPAVPCEVSALVPLNGLLPKDLWTVARTAKTDRDVGALLLLGKTTRNAKTPCLALPESSTRYR